VCRTVIEAPNAGTPGESQVGTGQLLQQRIPLTPATYTTGLTDPGSGGGLWKNLAFFLRFVWFRRQLAGPGRPLRGHILLRGFDSARGRIHFGRSMVSYMPLQECMRPADSRRPFSRRTKWNDDCASGGFPRSRIRNFVNPILAPK